jgi:hypothetical protein
MKRHMFFAVVAVSSSFALSQCASEPEVHHHYHNTTRVTTVKPAASVSTYKSAGVRSNSPEAFEAVTPPSSFSR